MFFSIDMLDNYYSRNSNNMDFAMYIFDLPDYFVNIFLNFISVHVLSKIIIVNEMRLVLSNIVI